MAVEKWMNCVRIHTNTQEYKFSIKLCYVSISQLRKSRKSWSASGPPGLNLPSFGMFMHFFSALFARECFAAIDLVISKRSEKCYSTTEQIILDCFGLRITTLLTISQNSLQEARYFVWTEHKSKLEVGTACVLCSEALWSLCILSPNSRFQTSGIRLHRSVYPKLSLLIALVLWLVSRPISKMQCKIIISWNIMQFSLMVGHRNYQISSITQLCK